MIPIQGCLNNLVTKIIHSNLLNISIASIGVWCSCNGLRLSIFSAWRQWLVLDTPKINNQTTTTHYKNKSKTKNLNSNKPGNTKKIYIPQEQYKIKIEANKARSRLLLLGHQMGAILLMDNYLTVYKLNYYKKFQKKIS